MVDVFGRQILSGLIHLRGFDASAFDQFSNDVVTLGVGVRISCVRDLKRQTRQGQAGVPCPRSDPDRGLLV